MRDFSESCRDSAALPEVDLVPRAVVDHVATTGTEKLGHRPVLGKEGREGGS